MAITNGHGEQNKIRILGQYRLRPMLHAVLLRGRSIACCCGQTITGEFHQFDAIDHAGNALNVLYASDECARALSQLSQTHGFGSIVLLPLFNPMLDSGSDIHGEYGAQSHADAKHPLNAEVEEAIYLALLCESSSAQQRSVFSQLLDKIRQKPTCAIMDWEVKTLNTTISTGGRCLTAMLDAQREKNAGLKHYAFPEISAALKREVARTGLKIHCNLG